MDLDAAVIKVRKCVKRELCQTLWQIQLFQIGTRSNGKISNRQHTLRDSDLFQLSAGDSIDLDVLNDPGILLVQFEMCTISVIRDQLIADNDVARTKNDLVRIIKINVVYATAIDEETNDRE